MIQKRYATIKALVLGIVHRNHGVVSPDAVSEAVRAVFPESRWNASHWAWYRYQIIKGRFKDQFTTDERGNLASSASRVNLRGLSTAAKPSHLIGESLRTGPRPQDDAVKRLGDSLLTIVRSTIAQAAGRDQDLQFKLNRWVFSRLLQDEMRVKRPIKARLWKESKRACHVCGRTFTTPKGVEIHRKDGRKAYSLENCEVVCHECHQELT